MKNHSAENSFSISHHILALKNELKKKHPSEELVLDRLRKTFDLRRKEILAGKPTADILEDFPCFNQADWVLEEMKLITGVDMLAKLQEYLGSEGRMKRLKSLIVDNWKKVPTVIKDLIEQEDACWIVALQSVTREQGFFLDQVPSSPYPTIVQLFSNTTVMVDGIRISQISDWKKAICAAMASYWVFNIRFPDSQKKFLSVVARLVFGIVSLKYPPPSLLKILNAL